MSDSVLTTVHGSFAAHVLAARLTDEGIDVSLRGATGGPYGLTMGDLARVDVYVPDDQMADARLVLLAGEVDEAMALHDPRPRRAVPRWVWVAAMVLLATAAVAPLLRQLLG
ncbi:MAG: DUF2007 domain-containing protein [Actinomycetes bacterium]